MDKRNHNLGLRSGPLLLALVCGLAVGCGSDDEPSSSPTTTESPPADDTSTEGDSPDEDGQADEEGEAAEPEATADVRDLDGLEVRLNPDGTVNVAGTDRWGDAIETQYTDHTYFRNAIPVLSRGVTPEQAAGLTALAAELGGGEAESEEDEEDDEGESEEAD